MKSIKLCLGTAQFGVNYGINNKVGKLEKKEIFNVLETAIENGIVFFDTSSAYGNAEEVLGDFINNYNLCKKIKVISKLNIQNTDRTLGAMVTQEVEKSLYKLKLDVLEGFLFHNPKDYYKKDLLNQMLKLKEQGIVKKIGASIYDFNDGIEMVEDKLIDYIQIPYNVLDQRANNTGFFRLSKEKRVTIFARSAFLQGLLLMEEDEIPEYIKESKPYIAKFKHICNEYCISKHTMALLFSYLNEGVDYVVLGVDTKEQLLNNLKIINDASLIEEVKKVIYLFEKEFINVEEKVILPYKWSN